MTVNYSAANIPDDSPTITINGTGFSSTPADDTVTFNDGVVGTVVTASATQLVVNVTTPPTSLGGPHRSRWPLRLGRQRPPGAGGHRGQRDLDGHRPKRQRGQRQPCGYDAPLRRRHAQSGDTISFAGGLSGDTVHPERFLTIGHSYTIMVSDTANLAVSGGNSVGVSASTQERLPPSGPDHREWSRC